MKLYIIIIVALIVITIIGIKTNNYIKQAHTYDTISLISLTISRSLTLETWNKDYDVIEKAHLMFPELKIKNGAIVDSWNNPIHIEIHRALNSFTVRIVSAGIDGKFGTRDDCVRQFQIVDDLIGKDRSLP